MKHSIYARAIIAISMLISTTVFAAEPGSISLKSIAQQIKVTTDEKGVQHTTLVPAGKVLPGTEVVYTLEYVNVGKHPATNVVFTNPVPEHMVYVPDSAEGKGTDITFSIDGGKTWGTPDQLETRDADGTTHTALPKDYNAVRWALKGALPPGAKGSVSFHAVLQ